MEQEYKRGEEEEEDRKCVSIIRLPFQKMRWEEEPAEKNPTSCSSSFGNNKKGGNAIATES